MNIDNNLVLGCFDAAFLINADKEHARLKRTSDELLRVGIRFEKFSAIAPISKTCRLRPGEIGCSLSHCEVVRLAKERNLRNILILEDDVVFRQDFCSHWDKLAPQVKNQKYDLLYFYDWQGTHAGQEARLVKIKGTLCTHAYVVSSNYYDAFLKTVLGDLSKRALDRTLLLAEGEKWAIVPNMIGQAAGKSTVDNSRKAPRWSASDG